jgi:hypothetical protein
MCFHRELAVAATLAVWGSAALGTEVTQTVALTGDAAPGTPSGVNFSFFNHAPLLNDAGQVAFHSWLIGSGVDSTNNSGIWRGAPGSLSLVARRGSAAPGTGSGVNFSSLFSPVLNDAGQVAFRAGLTGSGVDASNNAGIWRGAPGSLSLVARMGSAAPGTGSGVNFSSLTNPVLNDAGQVAFQATLTGSGVDSSNNQGIWRGAPGSLSLVARMGSAAPGTGSGVNFSYLSNPVLNDGGQVAFTAWLTGSEVNSSNDVGIWIGDGTESLLVVRRGDMLEGKVVSGFDIPTTPDQYARLSYGVSFTDGGYVSSTRPMCAGGGPSAARGTPPATGRCRSRRARRTGCSSIRRYR